MDTVLDIQRQLQEICRARRRLHRLAGYTLVVASAWLAWVALVVVLP